MGDRDTIIEGALWLLNNTTKCHVIQKALNTIDKHHEYILQNKRYANNLHTVLSKLAQKYDIGELELDEEESAVEEPVPAQPRFLNSACMVITGFYVACLAISTVMYFRPSGGFSA